MCRTFLRHSIEVPIPQIEHTDPQLEVLNDKWVTKMVTDKLYCVYLFIELGTVGWRVI